MIATDLGLPLGLAAGAARSAYQSGMMLSLVLGVGTMLVPALTGRGPEPLNDRRPESRGVWLGHGALAVGLIATYALEATPLVTWARAARAVLVGGVVFSRWGIRRRTRTRTRLSIGVWHASWAVALGVGLSAAFPQFYVHAMHVTYIAGFSLLTLMIGSRVTLAHGGYGLELESKSTVLRWSMALLLGATVLRVAGGLVPSAYVALIGTAAAAWVAGVILWASVFTRLAVFLRRSERPGMQRRPESP
jgi:hypothetical protein